MLTAKSQDIDKIMGLEYGTDDYMVKPLILWSWFLDKTLLRRMNYLRMINRRYSR